MEHQRYMKRALDLARKGVGWVNPNPLVGAVIVKDGRVIGEGYHKYFGGAHAEVNAIQSARESVNGSTMYVTLEPCSHYGKTPPCVDLMISQGIKSVIIGMRDPNELVAGAGIEKLKQHGIEVVVGVLEQECKAINEVFCHYMITKMPFVVSKYAMTLDGKIATKNGESKWITGNVAREHVHQTRHQLMGIMVGIDTVIKDNPQLTCRLEKGRSPIPIIVDSHLRVPMDSQVIQRAKEEMVIILTTNGRSQAVERVLISLGVKVICCKEQQGRVDLVDGLKQLGALGVDSILLEGGSELHYSALESGVVQKMQVYIAPKIFGGQGSKTAIGGKGIERIEQYFALQSMRILTLGEDLLIEGMVKSEEGVQCLLD